VKYGLTSENTLTYREVAFHKLHTSILVLPFLKYFNSALSSTLHPLIKSVKHPRVNPEIKDFIELIVFLKKKT
jgi:hypothetical protein